MYSVYFILNRTNGKAYAGVTSKTVRRRFQGHTGTAKGGSSLFFHKALRKYGSEAFDCITVWQGESKAEAEQTERRVISEMQLQNPERGYNLSEGGYGSNGMLGRTHSEETKRKIGNSSRGKHHHHRGGYHHSTETKRKMSESNKGQIPWCAGIKRPPLTTETKEKISVALKLSHARKKASHAQL